MSSLSAKQKPPWRMQGAIQTRRGTRQHRLTHRSGVPFHDGLVGSLKLRKASGWISSAIEGEPLTLTILVWSFC
jgi:hypothetical protein